MVSRVVMLPQPPWQETNTDGAQSCDVPSAFMAGDEH